MREVSESVRKVSVSKSAILFTYGHFGHFGHVFSYAHTRARARTRTRLISRGSPVRSVRSGHQAGIIGGFGADTFGHFVAKCP